MAPIKLADLIIEAENHSSLEKVVASHSSEAFDGAAEISKWIHITRNDIRTALKRGSMNPKDQKRFEDAVKISEEMIDSCVRIKYLAAKINKLMQ